MDKELLFGLEAREKLIKGIDLAVRAISSTLGPRGSEVAMDRDYGAPQVHHDGVNVSKEVEGLEKMFENMGAKFVIEASERSADATGDGTTLTAILVQAIVKEAHKNITAGANPRILRKGIEMAVDSICEQLQKISKPIVTSEEIKQIAIISAQDEQIGSLISKAIDKLGHDCIITVDESGSTEMSMDYKEGMQFDKGFVSPYFITKPETNEVMIDDPYLIITDAKLNTTTQWNNFANNLNIQANGDATKLPKDLVFIANEISGMFLANMVANKIKGNLNISAINAPGFGEKQKDILEDIAVISGGTFISTDKGMSIEKMQLSDLGRAKRVVSSKDSSLIIGGYGSEDKIKERTEQIKNQIKNSKNEFDTEKMRERLAKLTSGIAVLNVGANSEMEMRNKKEACIDAIAATRAAIEEGVVPGGEMALIYADTLSMVSSDIKDEQTGIEIVSRACQRPFEILMENSGYDAGQMKERLKSEVDKQKDDEDLVYGVDVMDGEVKDMLKAGIIDPVKVPRLALKHASSCAVQVSMTNTIITEIKDDK